MRTSIFAAALAAAILASTSCSMRHKIDSIVSEGKTARLSLPDRNRNLPQFEVDSRTPDSLVVRDADGREIIIMKAVYDEESGEMVATEELQAAVLVARFRNVAERNGLVDLEFLIMVSDTLQDSNWQLRFNPKMTILEDTLQLEPVILTGEDFRCAQLKGYGRYGRYLNSLSRDSLRFEDTGQLNAFVERNAGLFGIEEAEAREHFTRQFVKTIHEKRSGRSDAVRKRLIPYPIEDEGIRLDSVSQCDAPFIYSYRQTIKTRKGLRKVGVTVGGGIYDAQKCIYTIPESEPVTFYISSLSSFADATPRYKDVVIERRVNSSLSCELAFAAGSARVDSAYADNAAQIAAIRRRLTQLPSGDESELVLDSITVTASCSPDGRAALNERLSRQRSAAVKDFFGLGAGCTARGIAENWQLLDSLVAADPQLSPREKQRYRRLAEASDPDAREASLRKEPFFEGYARPKYYPALRFVRFDFAMHRRGMLKDTVHTEILDSAYMAGVALLGEHLYEDALAVLAPYQDYNTAVAYLSLDYNASALAILERLPQTPAVHYMQAIAFSRRGDEVRAVENLLAAVAEDPSYKYRGNLDPEIAAIIRRYGLFADDF